MSRQPCSNGDDPRYLCGSRAAEAMAAIIGRNGRVKCREDDRDRYGRIVATSFKVGHDMDKMWFTDSFNRTKRG